MDRKKLIRDIMKAILIGLPFFLLLAGKGKIPFILLAGLLPVTAGMIPNLRYFCLFNVKNQSEMNEEQGTCLREGCVDFVTAFSVEPDVYPEFDAYEHQGWFVGPTDNNYGYYHYYTRK